MVAISEIIWGWFVNKILDKILSIFSKKKKMEKDNIKILNILEQMQKEKLQLQQEKEKLYKELEKNREAIEKERKERLKTVSEYKRLIEALKRKGLSKDVLIQKYRKPIEAILISISDQRIYEKNGWRKAKDDEKFVRNFIINELNAKYLGGSLWIIPPTKVPKNLNKRADLQNFFENILYKYPNHTCKLNLITKINLKTSFWKNYLRYPQKRPRYHTIGEVLDIDEIFDKEDLADALADSKISLLKPILEGDIGFFASRILQGKELEIIHKNQVEIEEKLDNPTLRELAKDDQIPKITQVLTDYDIKDPEEVAKAIVEDAKFWYEKLK